jgi:biopolymer transport protein ExbD
MIALINVVFLLLIFLLIAGTVARPLSDELRLVEAEDMPPRSPPDAAVVLADGTLLYRGEAVTPETYAAARSGDEGEPLRLVPDRDLQAARLVAIVAALRVAGAAEVRIVTERALP